jgi:DNA polymerase III delta' subunit
MDFLSADSLTWLKDAQQRIRSAFKAGRLPHSLLLLSVPGLGAELLANWITALTLCESPGERPCDACASCRLLRSDSHPDVHAVRLEDDAQQIKIDQVRELIEALTLKSYRGGYKLGIIEGAEALNANGANAFLKTLEEPSADTLLIMIARPNHRLPATIASRCLRLSLRAPSTESAMHWRAERRSWRCSWTPKDCRPSMQICAGALQNSPTVRSISRCSAIDGCVPIRACVSLGLRTGSHSEYKRHSERRLRIKLRNRSACLPLYLSPR